jgi:hypothetical protein
MLIGKSRASLQFCNRQVAMRVIRLRVNARDAFLYRASVLLIISLMSNSCSFTVTLRLYSHTSCQTQVAKSFGVPFALHSG